MRPPAVAFEGVSKRFPGVIALEGVSFEVAAGSCHAVCGENGAGKSTLGKLLAGIHPGDGGRVLLHGHEVRFASPADARRAGVGMVHQELAFAENLTVGENLCLGDLPARATFVSRGKMRERARAMLAAIGADIHTDLDVDRRAGDLTVGEQQMLQIATAVGTGATVIVFDEPTSSLGQAEVERLYRLMAELRAREVTTLYVSHRMPEIYKLCDTITVLRDGRHVTTQPAARLDEAALVRAMIGRPLAAHRPRTLDKAVGPELLRVQGLSSPGKFRDVSFTVHAGEVVGMAGLVGAGRSEIAQALFGLDPDVTGEVFLDGHKVAIRDPAQAMALGVGLVPEDRKRQGLVLGLSCRENLSLPILRRRDVDIDMDLAVGPFVRRGKERALAALTCETLRVRTPSIDFVAAGLSGGNQQKIVLGKWLAAKCRLLLLDEPTRGVDVGAKEEIHDLVGRLAEGGAGVLLISSELPEVIRLARRILVLRSGRIVGEIAQAHGHAQAEGSQEMLMRLMSGIETTRRVVSSDPTF